MGPPPVPAPVPVPPPAPCECTCRMLFAREKLDVYKVAFGLPPGRDEWVEHLPWERERERERERTPFRTTAP